MTTKISQGRPGGCWRMPALGPLAGCLDASWDGCALRGNRHFGADPGWIGCLDAPMITRSANLGLEPAPAARSISRCWPLAVIPPGMGRTACVIPKGPVKEVLPRGSRWSRESREGVG